MQQRRAIQQAAEDGDGPHSQRQKAIGCLVDAVGGGEIGVGVINRAALGLFPAVVEMSRQHFELEVEYRFEQADLHQAALPGEAAADEAGEDALHQMRAGEEIHHCQAEGRRRAVGIAIEPDEAGYRLQQQVLARLVDPGTFIAVAGDFAIDDAGIDGADGFVIEAQPRHDARAEVLHDDIGLFDELLGALEIGWVFQIGGIAFLVAVDGMEERAFAVQFELGDIELAAEVATVGPFDLDDARAEIGQPQRGRRT